MNFNLALTGVIQASITVLLFILIAYLAYKVIRKLVSNYVSDFSFNTSLSLYFGAILFSTGWFLSGVSQSIVTVIKIFQRQHNLEETLLNTSIYLMIFTLIAVFIIFMVNVISTYVYSILMGHNPFKNLVENNIGTAILYAVLIATLSMILKDSFGLLMDSIIPYPEGPALF